MAHCHHLLSTLLCQAGFAQWVAKTMSCYYSRELPLPGNQISYLKLTGWLFWLSAAHIATD